MVKCKKIEKTQKKHNLDFYFLLCFSQNILILMKASDVMVHDFIIVWYGMLLKVET